MNNEYKKQLGTIGRLALDGRLIESLSELTELSREMGAWDVNSAVEKLQDSYKAMLRFVAEGVNDPSRADVTDSIISEALALTMQLSRRLSMELGTEIYYSTARTTLSRRGETLNSLVRAYRDELLRLETDFETIAQPGRTVKSEQMLREIFNRIWVTHPLSTDDFTAINDLMAPSMPRFVRALVISAVGIGHISYYDSRRLEWLLSRYIEYAESAPELSLRALVEAMVGMFRYRRRPISKKVKNILASAREVTFWNRDFTSVAIELMRATGTEKISEKLKDGLLGSMNDIPPELRDKLQKGEINLETIASDLNPEWADDISKSKIGQNLREMAEIQAEGGDVFMMSFSHMKRYPFFHDLANWYLPFYDSHSALENSDNEEGAIGSLLTRMPMLCDSDKYSLMLSLSSIPAAQRDQLATALNMQAEQMREELSEEAKVSGNAVRRNYVNKYVQNLYRIANLFRSKADLFNPFNTAARPDLLQIPALEGNPGDTELLETIAEFYFKNHFWPEAAAAFAKVDTTEMPDARRAQKKGYAYERSGMTDAALQAYDEAEMISNGSEWTLTRLAKLLRQTGNFNRSASYFKLLSDKNPDDPSITLDFAETLLEADRIDDAVKAFHKAVYILPESLRALRGLAWSQFLSGKFDQASSTYDKIIAFAPENFDYQRAGFVKWAQNDIREAIMYFRLSTQDHLEAIASLDTDILLLQDALEKAGIDVSQRSVLIETLRFLALDN